MRELLNPKSNNLFVKAISIAGYAALSLLVASRTAEVIADWREAYTLDANETAEVPEQGGIQHAA